MGNESNKALVIRGPGRGVPAIISGAGHGARRRFLEFFTANIRNRNARLAYARAVGEFFAWCEGAGLSKLSRIESTQVGAYVEQLQHAHAAPTVKQHLAAVRMLFDWLVMGQVVKSNPASVMRGPKHVVKRGKTPVLSPEEARQLFESIRSEARMLSGRYTKQVYLEGVPFPLLLVKQVFTNTVRFRSTPSASASSLHRVR